jgi:curli biogenesis system outer membrane secretion channel CsgG
MDYTTWERRISMDMRMAKQSIGWLVLAPCLLFLGCATPGEPTAKVTSTGGPSIQQAQMEQYDGPKARVAVGDFQVKAANATLLIGDGLREMMVT